MGGRQEWAHTWSLRALGAGMRQEWVPIGVGVGGRQEWACARSGCGCRQELACTRSGRAPQEGVGARGERPKAWACATGVGGRQR